MAIRGNGGKGDIWNLKTDEIEQDLYLFSP
jgi:hypothetical protein